MTKTQLLKVLGENSALFLCFLVPSCESELSPQWEMITSPKPDIHIMICRVTDLLHNLW